MEAPVARAASVASSSRRSRTTAGTRRTASKRRAAASAAAAALPEAQFPLLHVHSGGDSTIEVLLRPPPNSAVHAACGAAGRLVLCTDNGVRLYEPAAAAAADSGSGGCSGDASLWYAAAQRDDAALRGAYLCATLPPAPTFVAAPLARDAATAAAVARDYARFGRYVAVAACDERKAAAADSGKTAVTTATPNAYSVSVFATSVGSTFVLHHERHAARRIVALTFALLTCGGVVRRRVPIVVSADEEGGLVLFDVDRVVSVAVAPLRQSSAEAVSSGNSRSGSIVGLAIVGSCLQQCRACYPGGDVHVLSIYVQWSRSVCAPADDGDDNDGANGARGSAAQIDVVLLRVRARLGVPCPEAEVLSETPIVVEQLAAAPSPIGGGGDPALGMCAVQPEESSAPMPLSSPLSSPAQGKLLLARPRLRVWVLAGCTGALLEQRKPYGDDTAAVTLPASDAAAAAAADPVQHASSIGLRVRAPHEWFTHVAPLGQRSVVVPDGDRDDNDELRAPWDALLCTTADGSVLVVGTRQASLQQQQQVIAPLAAQQPVVSATASSPSPPPPPRDGLGRDELESWLAEVESPRSDAADETPGAKASDALVNTGPSAATSGGGGAQSGVLLLPFCARTAATSHGSSGGGGSALTLSASFVVVGPIGMFVVVPRAHGGSASRDVAQILLSRVPLALLPWERDDHDHRQQSQQSRATSVEAASAQGGAAAADAAGAAAARVVLKAQGAPGSVLRLMTSALHNASVPALGDVSLARTLASAFQQLGGVADADRIAQAKAAVSQQLRLGGSERPPSTAANAGSPTFARCASAGSLGHAAAAASLQRLDSEDRLAGTSPLASSEPSTAPTLSGAASTGTRSQRPAAAPGSSGVGSRVAAELVFVQPVRRPASRRIVVAAAAASRTERRPRSESPPPSDPQISAAAADSRDNDGDDDDGALRYVLERQRELAGHRASELRAAESAMQGADADSILALKAAIERLLGVDEVGARNAIAYAQDGERLELFMAFDAVAARDRAARERQIERARAEAAAAAAERDASRVDLTYVLDGFCDPDFSASVGFSSALRTRLCRQTPRVDGGFVRSRLSWEFLSSDAFMRDVLPALRERDQLRFEVRDLMAKHADELATIDDVETVVVLQNEHRRLATSSSVAASDVSGDDSEAGSARGGGGGAHGWQSFARLPTQLEDGSAVDLERLNSGGGDTWKWLDVEWSHGPWRYASRWPTAADDLATFWSKRKKLHDRHTVDVRAASEAESAVSEPRESPARAKTSRRATVRQRVLTRRRVDAALAKEKEARRAVQRAAVRKLCEELCISEDVAQ